MNKSSSTIYLMVSAEVDETSLSRALGKIMQKTHFNLSLVKGVYKLDLPTGVKGQALLLASFKALSEDVTMATNGFIKGLIVPLPSDKFIPYLEYVSENAIKFLFEIGQVHSEIYRDNLDLLEDIDSYSLETVMAYLEAGNSPAEASLRLYVHRNTVTYRIDHFIQQTGIDLKPFPNAVFVYFLIVRCLAASQEDI